VGTKDYEFWHPDSSSRYAQNHLRKYREQLEAGGNSLVWGRL
jgi:hypothetical protein